MQTFHALREDKMIQQIYQLFNQIHLSPPHNLIKIPAGVL
jgi:hypothetical protein